MFDPVVVREGGGAVAAAAVGAGGGPLPVGDPDGLLGVIEECEREVARLRARQVQAIAALEAARAGTVLAEFVDTEVGVSLVLSAHAARERVAVACTLVERLPGTLAALAGGGIDYHRAQIVAKAVMPLSEEVAAAVEERVLQGVAGRTAPQLRAALRRAVIAVDPQGAQRRHREAAQERRVALEPVADGMAWLNVLQPADDAVAVREALDLIARGWRREPGETRTLDQLRADALGQIARDILRAGGWDGPGSYTGGRADVGVGVGADGACHCHCGGGSGKPSGGSSPGGRAGVPDSGGRDGGTGASNGRDGAGTGSGNGAGAGSGNGAGAGSGSGTGTGRPGSGSPPGTGSGCGCRCSCRPGSGPGSGSGRGGGARSRRCPGQIHVTVGADTLLGISDQPGWLAGYGPIPAEMARKIARDATWRRILTDPVTGSMLDYGKDTHDPGQVLAGHVRTRDHTCVFPGCSARAERCDLDHTVAYLRGGRTEAGNLGCLCRRHHRAKQAGFELQQTQPGERVNWSV